MHQTLKIIKILFLISFGMVLGSQMIVHFVIAPRADSSTEQGSGVYNLFDHALPYTFGVLIITTTLFVLYMVLYYLNRSKISKPT